MLEEELQPMSYAKVFAKNKNIVHKPLYEGTGNPKQKFIEFFENKCYDTNQQL